MIDIHSKYDNMNKNVMFYGLICINNHVISGINCMLSHLMKYIRTLRCAKTRGHGRYLRIWGAMVVCLQMTIVENHEIFM